MFRRLPRIRVKTTAAAWSAPKRSASGGDIEFVKRHAVAYTATQKTTKRAKPAVQPVVEAPAEQLAAQQVEP